MKLKVLLPVAVMLMAGCLTACAPNISANNYSTSQTGQLARTERGVIIAATPVHVANSGGLGALAGAVAGGAGGSAIGGGARSNIAGAVGGAVVGGLIGDYAEKKMTSQTGMEYQVRLAKGSIVTITQGMHPLLAVNQHVFVIFSRPARVIADMS